MLLIDADKISTEGAAISKPAYFLSQSFYESLPRWPDTGGASLCWQRGNRLFSVLYIQVQPAEDELAKLNR